MKKLDNLNSLADEAGVLKTQEAAIKARYAEIKDTLIEAGAEHLIGEAFEAKLVESNVARTDWKAIAKKLDPSKQLITAHTTHTDQIALRVSARKDVAAMAVAA